MNKLPGPSCYEKALELLARRPHLRQELDQKLTSRGYSREDIEEALDRAARQRYLDDLQCARDLVAARLARGGIGRRRLEAELLRRGASREVIREVLAQISPDSDLERAQDAARRWLERGGKEGQALARHLDRRGFSRRVILLILEQHQDLLVNDRNP